MNTVPSHLSETLFRHFEPYIALALRNWPKETCYDLDLIPVADRYSPATFVGRFRDAILSLQRFSWPTTMVDTEKLWELSAGKAFCVWWEAGTQRVWFKQRRRAGRPTHLVGEARERIGADTSDAPPPRSPVLLKDLTENELESFCCLLSGKRIDGPVLVEGNLAVTMAESVATYSNNMDISFIYDEKRNVTIIT